MRCLLKIVLSLLCVTFSLASQSYGQKTLTIKNPSPGAVLLNEFGITNSERRSASFDHFFSELQKNPSSVGYVFLYCGRTCRYGEIEAHIRGIELKTYLRRFERKRFIVLHAGYRDEGFGTELWLVPPGAAPPSPTRTINIKNVEFKPHGKWSIEAYDCCDDMSGVWEEMKKKN